MSLSVTAPIQLAIDRTRAILFRPFDIGKWMGLGFCAFLARLVENNGGGGTSYTPDGSDWGGGSGEGVAEAVASAREWLAENWVAVVSIGLVVSLLIVGILALVSWLGSRGRFMFLDGVVRNRGAVKEPWHAFAHLARSLFRFQLLFLLLGTASLLLSVALGIGIALADIEAERFEALAITGLVVGGGLVLLISLAMVVINLIARDFVVPTMYARDVLVKEAFGIVRRELLLPHTGPVVLYALMRALISFVIGIAVVLAVIATCCILAIPLVIPYIGTVLLLPIYVFMRSYSLYFIAPLGGPWRLVEPVLSSPAPAEGEGEGYGSDD